MNMDKNHRVNLGEIAIDGFFRLGAHTGEIPGQHNFVPGLLSSSLYPPTQLAILSIE
jgi:hypothetical protein